MRPPSAPRPTSFTLSITATALAIVLASPAVWAQTQAQDCAVFESIYTANGRAFNWTTGNCCGSTTPFQYYTGGQFPVKVNGTIACDATGRITRAVLSGMQFQTSLPDLSPLTAIQYLDLSSNSWNGTVPPLTALKALQYFDMSFCRFVDSNIPAIAGLANLQTFRIYFSNFKGTIPSLDGLSSLQEFNVSQNHLSGDVPSSVASLPALTNLDLRSNNFTSLPSFPGMSKVMILDASDNQLTTIGDGSLPTGLTKLVLRKNLLKGDPASFLKTLSSLTYLDLSNNKYTSSFPDLTPLTKLGFLDLSSNMFQGNIDGLLPASIAICVITYTRTNPCVFSTAGNYPKSCIAPYKSFDQPIPSAAHCTNGVPDGSSSAGASPTSAAGTNSGGAGGGNAVTSDGALVGLLVAGGVLAGLAVVLLGVGGFVLYQRTHRKNADSEVTGDGQSELNQPWESAIPLDEKH